MKIKQEIELWKRKRRLLCEHNMIIYIYISCKFLTYLSKDTEVKRKDMNTLRAGVDVAFISIVFSCSSFLMLGREEGGTCQSRKRSQFLTLPLPSYTGLIPPFQKKIHQQSLCVYLREYL